jgi:hypothetical protein
MQDVEACFFSLKTIKLQLMPPMERKVKLLNNKLISSPLTAKYHKPI